MGTTSPNFNVRPFQRVDGSADGNIPIPGTFPLWECGLVPLLGPKSIKSTKLGQPLLYPFTFRNLAVTTLSYVHFRDDDKFPREHSARFWRFRFSLVHKSK
jgi:hypothetical protein